MPPSQFRQLITDPTHEGKDYIMDHPDMAEMMRGVGPGIKLLCISVDEFPLNVRRIKYSQFTRKQKTERKSRSVETMIGI
jgi:hypothetical protein